MAERSKAYLKQEFRDGERPTGADFGDLIDSYLSKVDDGITLNADSNLELPGGLRLGDAVNGSAGTLRFNGGQVQVNDGATWNPIGGAGGGAFTPVGAGTDVAYNGGNVGIGDFTAAAPTYRLEVNLGANTGTADRVRFGNGVLSNGQGASQAFAQFSHTDHATGNNNFALRQGPGGDVNLNAPTNQPITISHNRTQARIFVAGNGQVIVGNNAPIGGSTDPFQVNGNACKTQGGADWAVCSDARLKQDVQPFNDGLNQLLRVRPVRFRYNGLFNTNPAEEEVGIIGQEMEQVFPYMISRQPAPGDILDDLRIYNGSALTYVMVNAIQELAAKVADLEKRLAEKDTPQA